MRISDWRADVCSSDLPRWRSTRTSPCATPIACARFTWRWRAIRTPSTASGEGYRRIADLILARDPINAQTAARFVPSLGRWRRIAEGDRKRVVEGTRVSVRVDFGGRRIL